MKKKEGREKKRQLKLLEMIIAKDDEWISSQLVSGNNFDLCFFALPGSAEESLLCPENQYWASGSPFCRHEQLVWQRLKCIRPPPSLSLFFLSLNFIFLTTTNHLNVMITLFWGLFQIKRHFKTYWNPPHLQPDCSHVMFFFFFRHGYVFKWRNEEEETRQFVTLNTTKQKPKQDMVG